MDQDRDARALRALARLHGIQAAYTDGLKQRRRASDEAVIAILRAVGVPLSEPSDAPEALRAAREERTRAICDPVAVCWLGEGGSITVRAPAGVEEVTLEVEGGPSWRAQIDAAEVAVPLPSDLAPGYHRLRVAVGNHADEATVIAAPLLAHAAGDAREWGVFLPLYALRSSRNWGAGNLTDLEHLLRLVSDRGGSIVATLPILAAFLDEPFDPSPYSPASRLWWSEFFIDVEALPEVRASEEVRALLADARPEIETLRKDEQVDYARGMAVRRRVLEACGRALLEGERRDEFGAFVREHPDVERYAAFRAATEAHGPWTAWPQKMPDGDPGARAYHAAAQFFTHTQLEQLGRTAAERGAGLYLDLPLGVHPSGYDVWAHRDLFASGVSGGAPPDAFFTKGQNWRFPPMIPDRVRATGYAYPIACLRTLLRYATVLRIDHVIGLHRLFWVPDGFEAADGAFVRWPNPEEWYAILSLESHTAKARVIGEDLGTVPRAVREAMARHGILRSYIVQEEFRDDERRPLNAPPARSLAALNTHDMPPFASWWGEHDIAERLTAGLLDDEGASRERATRAQRRDRLRAFMRARGLLAADDEDVPGALLEHLAASRAQVVIASLEDLWGEVEPQNRPGTTTEHPNWRRKARVPLEGLAGTLEVVDRLGRISRRRGRSHP